MEENDVIKCFDELDVAHYRDGEGYRLSWYDMEGDLGFVNDYTIHVPKQDGDLYFTVESYYANMVPISCLSG